MTFQSARGATPLTEEDLRDLIPNLTTQKQLDEFEAENILRGQLWARKSRVLQTELLSVSGICVLHKRMFDQTWRWAGDLRLRALTTIGVAPHLIQPDLGNLFNDVRFWIDNKIYSEDEIAIRFSHRLVQIHPFRNGNGRHSRIAADLLAVQLGKSEFAWGREIPENERRDRYIEALKAADGSMDVSELTDFARN
ncbi:MAG: mobile mystery protein B [Bdellovibrionaceae bacterium]|nr:mobile mystery protein B [Pseudobdellovibrionaceae bacterium]